MVASRGAMSVIQLLEMVVCVAQVSTNYIVIFFPPPNSSLLPAYILILPHTHITIHH